MFSSGCLITTAMHKSMSFKIVKVLYMSVY